MGPVTESPARDENLLKSVGRRGVSANRVWPRLRHACLSGDHVRIVPHKRRRAGSRASPREQLGIVAATFARPIGLSCGRDSRTSTPSPRHSFERAQIRGHSSHR